MRRGCSSRQKGWRWRPWSFGRKSAEASREAVWIIVQSGSMALATGQILAMEVAQAEELEGLGF